MGRLWNEPSRHSSDGGKFEVGNDCVASDFWRNTCQDQISSKDRDSLVHVSHSPHSPGYLRNFSETSQKLPGDGEFASDAAASDAGEELRLAPTAGEATTTAGHLAVRWLGWTVRSRHSHSYPAMKGSAGRTMSRLCGFICHFSSVAIVAE